MIFILEGVVERVLPVQEGVSKANKPWKILSYVIKTKDEKYPKIVMIETLRNLILNTGEDVRLGVEIESREYNGKWFTSVRAIGKIDKDNKLIPLEAPKVNSEDNALLSDAKASEDNSGLPF